VQRWITAEVAGGRMFGTAALTRAGEYTTEHACAVGLELISEVGKVYADGGAPGLAEGLPHH
jgi:hypothetical protein